MPAVSLGEPTAVRSSTADESESFSQTYPLNANGRLNISNVNGSITVEAWDRNEVKLEYVKTADSKERLADVEVRIDSRPDYITIETDYDNWKRDKNSSGWKFSGKLEVEFRLWVPRGAMLNEVETVNGSVDVSNFNNFTKVSAVNGSVNARNIRGTARLSTVNGEVHADFDRLETGSKISLDTVNGRVNLVIPSDSNATLKADSLNGSITNDFGLPVRKGKYVGRDMYGRLAGGDVQIKLSSVNGGLSIGRKNDGKAMSPATNLLPEKGKGDDEDWDGDVDVDVDKDVKVAIDTKKINKQITQSMKESQKAMEKAVIDTRVEVDKIQPEIARAVADSVAASADAVTATAVSLNSEQMQRSIQDAVRQQAVLARAVNAVFMPGITRVDSKSDTIKVKGVPTVTIDAEPASVKVTGWDRDEVQYNVVQYLQPRRADALKVSEQHTDSTVTISVDEPTPDHNNRFYGDGARTRVEVMVPRRTNLKINANGEVRVQGISGELNITGTDGAINVRDSDGRLHVASSDGRIRVIGFRGDVDAESSDGSINLEGDFASLIAKASEGRINLILPANASAFLESNCDQVRGDGIDVIRVSTNDEHSSYRIGGGETRRFVVESEGGITVRSAEYISQIN
jgi:DUF4097 and DUF4098 domain-containing protein YvlB